MTMHTLTALRSMTAADPRSSPYAGGVTLARRSRTLRILGWIGASAGVLSAGGCLVGPEYTSPVTAMPDGYRELPTTPMPGVTFAGVSDTELRWWRRLGDPLLDSLVERAIAANPNVALAGARLRQARAVREEAQAQLYPEVHAGGSLLRVRNDSGLLGAPEATVFQVGFDAVWVVDLFGGTRRHIEAAKAGEGAVAAERRGVVLMVAAETTRAYVELRGLQYELGVLQAILQQQREILALTVVKNRAGLASDLDVLRARTDVEAAEAELPALQQAIRQYIHLLGTLLALEPTALSGELQPVKPIPRIPSEIRVGAPSDLLRRRPDIQAAERHLAVATAEVGVAVARLFPQLTIGAAAGVGDRINHGGPDPGSNGYYALGPSIDWPLFDAGRRQSAVEASRAEVDAAKAQYEDTVRRAFAEVESTLVAVDRAQARRDALLRLCSSAVATLNIARSDYQSGLLDQLEVLDAQRQANRAHVTLAQSEVRLVVDVVTLYKALGGGWEAGEPQPAKEPAETAVTNN
jgi:NodT family efflux transporter outer membrane factor (OMF) lipoprotein